MQTPLDFMRSVRSIMLLQPQTRYIGSNVMLLELIESNDIDTACTNGKVIKFNPEFVSQLTKRQGIFLLAHEVMHCILKHPWRRGGRDPKLWNIACDFVINGHLIIMGLGEFITDGLHDEQYNGMSAERVYALRMLEDDPQSDDPQSGEQSGEQSGDPQSGDPQSGDPQSGDESGEQSGDESGDDQSDDQSDDDQQGGGSGDGVPTFEEAMQSGIGGVEDAPADEPELEREWDRNIMVTTQQAKDSGTLPGNIAQAIDKRNESVISWQDQLNDLMSGIGSLSEQSWAKKNRRFEEYLPGIETRGLGHVVIGTDTSGSMDKSELERAVSETMEVCDIYSPDLTFIPCDSRIDDDTVQQFESGCYPDDASEFNLHGGGGTDPKPVFDWCAENGEPDVMIFFTDGYVYKWPEDPGYPVVWAFTSPVTKHNPPAPFGTVIECCI